MSEERRDRALRPVLGFLCAVLLGGCLDVKAPEVCTPGELRCSGSQVQLCEAEGSAWVAQVSCGAEATCIGGSCVKKRRDAGADGDAAGADATGADASSDATSGDATSGDATSGDATSGDAASGDAASGDAASD